MQRKTIKSIPFFKRLKGAQGEKDFPFSKLDSICLQNDVLVIRLNNNFNINSKNKDTASRISVRYQAL